MTLHKTILLAASLALGITAWSCVLADDRYDEYPPAERFKIHIGGFLIDSFDTTARFDSAQFPIGTLIDIEDDFDVDSSETVLRIDGFYRFNFLDPEALRARCNDVLEDAETRARAVMLTEELQRLALQCNRAVVASVEAYLHKLVQWDSSANDLIELLQPWDSARIETVQEIVRVRQSMQSLITAEQWNRVFG